MDNFINTTEPKRLTIINKTRQNTVSRILAAAELAILNSGSSRINIVDVCKSSDISRGTFYRYFESQEELLAALAGYETAEILQTMHTELDTAIATAENASTPVDFMFSLLQCESTEKTLLTKKKLHNLMLAAPGFTVPIMKKATALAIDTFQPKFAGIADQWDNNSELDRSKLASIFAGLVIGSIMMGS